MTRNHEESRRKWWIIVAAVLLLHLAVLVFVRPEFFDFLLRDVNSPAGGARSSRSASLPDAIIAIQIDIEDESAPVPTEPSLDPERPAPPTPSPAADATGDADALQTIDLGDLLGEARSPRQGGALNRGETIPPRPVEITWPETRRLKHCIGGHVDVRILVDADGRIREVRPEPADVPEDCLRAALDAAARIKFTAGRVGGRPAALWAQVRIDFEEKR